jgi:serine/threonine protein kinase
MAAHGLPTRTAVDLGVHIVRGIAAADERGIIHRDLKPENIFITKDGVVKVLFRRQRPAADDSGRRRLRPG